ncbi:MAG TPA: sigma-70 family RNA polymerase sigma factor [Opitutaceae bacterium]|nr:sigma-70 family RNA polymerase sigma factor [Opitutaceae bacterium]
MTNDAQLLRRYLDERSQEAFAELVRRHIGWVYQAGLRRTGGRHALAQDVAQYVFSAVANHADALSRRESLAGWLYVTARYAASRALRSEIRRRKHETAAHVMTELEQSSEDPEWDRIRPALDKVMDTLSARDREALLLRFSDGLGFAGIGAVLGVSEDGARKRVERSLEKMRVLLARRGVTSTAAALGGLLAAQSTAAVAGDVVAAVTSGALSGAAVPGASMLGVFQFMNATKATLGGLGAVAALLCIGTMGIAIDQTMKARDAEAALALAVGSRENERPARLDPPESGATVAPRGRATSQAAAGVTARADAKAFLAAFGGTLGAQYRVRSQREIEQRHALFFRLANLPEEKRRAFVARTVQLWEDSLEVTPGSILARVDTLDEAALRETLGEDGFRQWNDLVTRAEVAKTWSMEVAKAASAGSEPLTLDQIVELHQIVREESREYGAGGKINERTVDWEAVAQRARAVLNGPQWEHAQSYLSMREAMRALEKLAAAGPGVAAANPR